MSETTSSTDENLSLLEGIEAFSKHALQIPAKARRHLVVLSENLDFPLYDNDTFADSLSALVRSDRNGLARILVKEPRPLIERGHSLLKLSRRLPSKVQIRKLLIPPQNDTAAFMIGDNDLLLYKHDDREYQGFVNYRAPNECKSLLIEFNHLWEHHSVQDENLRELRI